MVDLDASVKASPNEIQALPQLSKPKVMRPFHLIFVGKCRAGESIEAIDGSDKEQISKLRRYLPTLYLVYNGV